MAAVTKASQVERDLRQSILTGTWSPGEKLPPEAQILSRFKVSRTTLREALITLVNDGLIRRQPGVGTFVSQAVKTGRVIILSSAELLASPLGYYFRCLVEDARKHIQNSGFRPILAAGHGESSTSKEFISSIDLLDHPVAKETLGVLSTVSLGPLGERLAGEGIPSVAIADKPEMSGRCAVVLDTQRRVELAVELLREHGHTDFAIVYSQKALPRSESTPAVGDRLKSWVRARGIDLRDDRLVAVPWSWDFGHAYDAFKQWWARPDRPNAVFFYEDAVCDVATRAILELGIKIPQELAVVTHANVGRTFHFPVPLTCVE